MRALSKRFSFLCAAVAALAGCQPEAPIVGRLATEAEKEVMPGFLVTLDRREITILTPLEPALPGCEIELDQRWRAVIPPQAETDVGARVPLSDFRDGAGGPPRGDVRRVEVMCPGESGPLRYTGRKTGSAPTVTEWIYPDQ